MFESLFIVSLFLPIVWRVILALLFSPSRRRYVTFVLFLAPLALVGVSLCWMAFSEGVDSLFIPLMLLAFWPPQLAVIVFFVWCDHEEG